MVAGFGLLKMMFSLRAQCNCRRRTQDNLLPCAVLSWTITTMLDEDPVEENSVTEASVCCKLNRAVREDLIAIEKVGRGCSPYVYWARLWLLMWSKIAMMRQFTTPALDHKVMFVAFGLWLVLIFARTTLQNRSTGSSRCRGSNRL